MWVSEFAHFNVLCGFVREDGQLSALKDRLHTTQVAFTFEHAFRQRAIEELIHIQFGGVVKNGRQVVHNDVVVYLRVQVLEYVVNH